MNVGKAVSSRVTYGGLATLWCDENFQLKRWCVTQHCIFTDLYRISSKISLSLFILHVPVNYNEKKECWKSLSEFLEVNSSSNTVVTGDINISLAPSEKNGGLRGKDQFHDTVEELILSLDLNDIKPKSRRFTWTNNRVGSANIASRLDMFLVHSSLLDGNSIISSKILPKLSFYHHPISLLFEK